MRVRDGQAQGVGGRGARGGGQLQQALHHGLHLRLGGLAVAGHGLLHLQRGVFGHRQLAGHQRRHAGAARLAQQQRGLRVDVDEHDLDRRYVGRVARLQLADAVEQHLQPRRQVALLGARGLDHAAGHVAQRGALGVEHAKARGAQAGVDAEDSHCCILYSCRRSSIKRCRLI